VNLSGLSSGKLKTSLGQRATQNPHPEHALSIVNVERVMRIESVGHPAKHLSQRAPEKRTLEQRSWSRIGFNDGASRDFMPRRALSVNLFPLAPSGQREYRFLPHLKETLSN
jgi:hypothetical protein